MTVDVSFGSVFGGNIELKKPGESFLGAGLLVDGGNKLLGLRAAFVLFHPLAVLRETVENMLGCFFVTIGFSDFFIMLKLGAFHLGMLQFMGFIASAALDIVPWPPGEDVWADAKLGCEKTKTIVTAAAANANRIEVALKLKFLKSRKFRLPIDVSQFDDSDRKREIVIPRKKALWIPPQVSRCSRDVYDTTKSNRVES